MNARVVISLVSLAGCAGSSDGADPSGRSARTAVRLDTRTPTLSATTGTTSAVSAPSPGRSPLRILLEPHGTPAAGGTLALTAHIERGANFDRPLRVVVRVPAGARAEHGPLEFDLPPSPTPRVDTVEYVFALTTVPASDLVLVADARGTGWGAHAEVPYRFGRPETAVQGPAAEGLRVVVGGIDLGPAVSAGRRR